MFENSTIYGATIAMTTAIISTRRLARLLGCWALGIPGNGLTRPATGKRHHRPHKPVMVHEPPPKHFRQQHG